MIELDSFINTIVSFIWMAFNIMKSKMIVKN